MWQWQFVSEAKPRIFNAGLIKVACTFSCCWARHSVSWKFWKQDSLINSDWRALITHRCAAVCVNSGVFVCCTAASSSALHSGKTKFTFTQFFSVLLDLADLTKVYAARVWARYGSRSFASCPLLSEKKNAVFCLYFRVFFQRFKGRDSPTVERNW